MDSKDSHLLRYSQSNSKAKGVRSPQGYLGMPLEYLVENNTINGTDASLSPEQYYPRNSQLR